MTAIETATTTTTLHDTTLHESHYTTPQLQLHYSTTLHYTTRGYATLYNTQNYSTLHYTNYTTPQLQLQL